MSTSVLSYYEAIEQASADMLDAARAGDWDEVVKLEGACVLLISQLKQRRARTAASRKDDGSRQVAHHAAHPGQRRRDPPPGRSPGCTTCDRLMRASRRPCTEGRCDDVPGHAAGRARPRRRPRHLGASSASATAASCCACCAAARRQRAGDAERRRAARPSAASCGRWMPRSSRSTSVPTPTACTCNAWRRTTRQWRWPTWTA